MNRVKSSLTNQWNKNSSIKKSFGSISRFERSKRMLKIRPQELDQLIKLLKRLSLSYKKKHSESILYKEGDEVQISNLINKINYKKSYFNREKRKKVSKYQKEERIILLVLLKIWSIKFYIRVISIPKKIRCKDWLWN